VSFDEDLYFTLPNFCLTPQECPKLGASGEDFCDYSRRDSLCGVKQDNLTSSQCQFREYCDESEYPWITLSPSQPVRGLEMNAFEYHILRFYFNVSTPCSGFRITMTKHYGTPGGGLKRGSYQESQAAIFWDRSTASTFIGHCPGNYRFGFGTYFLGLWSNSLHSKVDVNLEIFDINMTNTKAVKNETEIHCTPGSLALCPQLGEPFHGTVSAGGGKMLMVPVTKCTQLMIHHEISSPTGTLAMFFKINSPALSTTGFAYPAAKHPFVINLCPSDPSSPSNLWITVATEVIGLQFVFYISDDSSEWNSDLILLENLGSVGSREFIDGSVQVSCLGQTFPCFAGADSFGSCQVVWNPPPRKDENFLWPIPRLFVDSVTDRVLYEDPEDSSENPMVSNELRASLLLESYYKSQSLVPFPTWETQLEQCVLSFSPIFYLSTKNGEIPSENVPVQGKYEESSCEVGEFQALSQTMDEYASRFTEAETIEEIITYRYMCDIQTFNSTWQVCDSFIKSLLVPEQAVVVFPKSRTCSVDMMKNASIVASDPCCNETLEWGVCCVEREVETMRTSYNIQSKNSQNQTNENEERSSPTTSANNVWQVCQSPDCVNALLQDYIFYEELIDSSAGCDAVVSTTLESHQYSEMSFYRDCKAELFGEDQKGKSCVSDDDCHRIGSERCDIFREKCLFLNDTQRQARMDLFFQCLAEKMPAVIRNELTDQYGFNMNDHRRNEKELVAILNEYFVVEDCDDDFGRSVESVRYLLVNNLGVTNCGPTDWQCSDSTCEIPMFLEMKRQYGRPGSPCKRTMDRRFSRSSECLSYQMCNWNNSLQSDSSTATNQIAQNMEICQNISSSHSKESGFCGYCTSPTFCVKIEGVSKSECSKLGKVCFNGADQYNLNITDEETCQDQFGTCTVNCSSSSSSSNHRCSRSDCLHSGRCSDQDVIEFEQLFHSTTNQNWTQTDIEKELNGLCLSPMVDWNRQDCNQFSSTSVTNRGTTAVLIQDFPFDSVCVRDKNFTECQRFADRGYWWYSAAKNQEECEERKSCQEPEKIFTTLRSVKDQDQCEMCQGEYTPSFSWTPGEWTEGQMVQVEWKEGTYNQSYSWSDGVNFEDLSQFFLDVLSREFALQLVTELECRVNPKKEVMDSILCVCDNGLEQCDRPLSEDVSLGVGELCLNSSLSLMAPPAIVTFNPDSLPLRNQTSSSSSSSSVIECIGVTVLKMSQSTSTSSSETSISLTFRKREMSRDNVWNSKGATIGNTIGDGIELQFATQIDQLTHVKVCLMAQTEQYSQDHDDSYHVIDFGIKNMDDHRIYALGAQVTIDRELICVENLTISQNENVFFPIIRKGDWEGETGSGYSSGQIGVYSVMFILYLVPFLIILAHEWHMGFAHPTNTRFFNLTFASALCVRAIYFLGLLIGQPTSSESVPEFLAAEFPTIAYLSAVSAAGMLWAMLKVPNMTTLIKRVTVLGNLFLISLFIVFAVVFFVLQVDGSYSCFGLLYSEPDHNDQDILRIIYYSVLCFFSLVVGCLTLYFSSSLFKIIVGWKAPGTNAIVKKWLVVTLVCSLSVVFQCVFALVYTLSITPTYQYALVLIGLEIIPSLPILSVILSEEIGRTLTSKTSSHRQAQTITQPDKLT